MSETEFSEEGEVVKETEEELGYFEVLEKNFNAVCIIFTFFCRVKSSIFVSKF